VRRSGAVSWTRVVRLASTAVAVATVALLASGAGGASDQYSNQTTRAVVGEAPPPEAPGDLLTVAKVTIPPKGLVSKHRHPVMQIATVISGRLRYTVFEGTAYVTRSGKTTQSQEMITGGHTITLNTGDTVTENPDMVHQAVNPDKKPVVVWTAVVAKPGETITVNVP